MMGGFKGEDGADDAVRDIALYATIFAGNGTGNDSNRIVYQTVACTNTAVMDGKPVRLDLTADEGGIIH